MAATVPATATCAFRIHVTVTYKERCDHDRDRDHAQAHCCRPLSCQTLIRSAWRPWMPRCGVWTWHVVCAWCVGVEYGVRSAGCGMVLAKHMHAHHRAQLIAVRCDDLSPVQVQVSQGSLQHCSYNVHTTLFIQRGSIRVNNTVDCLAWGGGPCRKERLSLPLLCGAPSRKERQSLPLLCGLPVARKA
eukprot:364504-Chlamydomonas_euryale.AAC.2